MKHYTLADLKFIRDNYARKGAAWCAERLGRKPTAVTQFACKHNVPGIGLAHKLREA